MSTVNCKPIALNYCVRRVHPKEPQKNQKTSIQFCGNDNGIYDELRLGLDVDHATQSYSDIASRRSGDAYLQEILQRILPTNKRQANQTGVGPLVELGCNRGNNLIPLAKMGYDLYGVDLDEDLLKDLARNISNSPYEDRVQLAQWDFGEKGDLPWQGEINRANPKGLNLLGKVKAFYSVHVLSHFSSEGLQRTIQGLKHFLAPGGYFIATVIQKSGPEFLSFLSPDQRVRSGFVEHTPLDMAMAFQGLEETSYSRPFKKGELDKWKLPEEKLHWRVFRKPV